MTTDWVGMHEEAARSAAKDKAQEIYDDYAKSLEHVNIDITLKKCDRDLTDMVVAELDAMGLEVKRVRARIRMTGFKKVEG